MSKQISIATDDLLKPPLNLLTTVEPGREEVLEQLEKLIGSQALHGNESLKALLRFITLKALDEPDPQIKEYTLAVEVFGRSSNFDPQIDSVVRVQTGRLRSRLHQYYETEGRDDQIIIALPKGGYIPTFTYAHSPLQPEPSEIAALALSVAGQPPAVPERNWKLLAGLLAGLLAIVAVGLSIVAVKYRAANERLAAVLATQSTDSGDSGEWQALSVLWGDFLRAPDPILIAYSNAIFQGNSATGMKYLNPLRPRHSATPQSSSDALPDRAPWPGQKPALVFDDHYTGVGEVMGVHFLAAVLRKAGRPYRVKRGLLLTWEDVKTENMIFLGSATENLLLRDLPQEQDFIFDSRKDEHGNPRAVIINLKPRPGEDKLYSVRREGPSTRQISEVYAVVSLLRGLGKHNKLLILAGLTTLGTQAAAEYVSGPEYARDLIARLSASAEAGAPRLPAYYQVVLRVKVNDGVPVRISYVTHHSLN